MANRLFVVATPIGNLGDITLRAIDTLKSVGYILCEDTRQTAKLLHRFDIHVPMISYRDQNHERVVGKIKKVIFINDVAIVSDSGTPNISDPGFKLIREFSKDPSIQIIPIPGPSAITTAISASGLPTDSFTFIGFLPKSDVHRKNSLIEFNDTTTTLVLYESPFRIHTLLEEILETLGDRFVCLAKDLTKLDESITTQKVSVLLKNPKYESTKGEFVVLIAKKGYEL